MTVAFRIDRRELYNKMDLSTLLIYLAIIVFGFLLAILLSDADLTLKFAEKFGKPLGK